MQKLRILLPIFLFLTACTVATSLPTTTPASSPTPALPTTGAGFRFSFYGPPSNPGPEYWVSVGEQMAAKFPGAGPMGIWIIGDIEGHQAFLNFPGTSDDPNIIFGKTDDNEAALAYFDEHNVRIWLQVESGDADMLKVIDLVLKRYGKHPCVIGFGVDLEWYHSKGDEAEGQPVTDAEAAAWVAAVRAYNPSYRLFLKHWDVNWMPPTYREGIVFVDDSQQFDSLDQMVDEFVVWGQHFTPAPVAFQFGYSDDQKWWGSLADAPGEIGKAILAKVPNTSALFWVDFTVLDVFPPK
jgi:hypothetical protein